MNDMIAFAIFHPIIFGVVVNWLALACLAGIIANTNGRSDIGWFFASLLVTPVMILILRALPNLRQEARKICPQCAEPVRREARICRFCRHDFHAETAAANASFEGPFTKAIGQLSAEAAIAINKAENMGYKVRKDPSRVTFENPGGGYSHCYSNSDIIRAAKHFQ